LHQKPRGHGRKGEKGRTIIPGGGKTPNLAKKKGEPGPGEGRTGGCERFAVGSKQPVGGGEGEGDGSTGGPTRARKGSVQTREGQKKNASRTGGEKKKKIVVPEGENGLSKNRKTKEIRAEGGGDLAAGGNQTWGVPTSQKKKNPEKKKKKGTKKRGLRYFSDESDTNGESATAKKKKSPHAKRRKTKFGQTEAHHKVLHQKKKKGDHLGGGVDD